MVVQHYIQNRPICYVPVALIIHGTYCRLYGTVRKIICAYCYAPAMRWEKVNSLSTRQEKVYIRVPDFKGHISTQAGTFHQDMMHIYFSTDKLDLSKGLQYRRMYMTCIHQHGKLLYTQDIKKKSCSVLAYIHRTTAKYSIAHHRRPMLSCRTSLYYWEWGA